MKNILIFLLVGLIFNSSQVEDKTFNLLTVKHIPARSISYLFKGGEVITTDVFIMPSNNVNNKNNLNNTLTNGFGF